MRGKWKALWHSSPSPEDREEARHEGEVEGYVQLVAVAEVRADVGGPRVRLGEQGAALVLAVEGGPDLAEELVGLREILAVGALPLEEIGHRVAAKAVEALVEPEAHDIEQFAAHLGVVVVEIGLVVEEPVPVVGLGHRVPRPVGLLALAEADAGGAVALSRRVVRASRWRSSVSLQT